MKFGLVVKEKIARVIAEHFTTTEIERVFTEINIPTDRALYAKWKIVVDAFGKMSEPSEAIPHVLEVFAHPLNFDDPAIRKKFVKELNVVLAYEKLELHATDKGAQILDDSGFPAIWPEEKTEPHKTPADYVKEVIAFFKDEYNKVLIAGLTYEYPLGEAPGVDGRYSDAYLGRQKAVQQLARIGFITELEYGQDMDDYNTVYDTAICKIDESKLTQKDEPKATAAGAEAIAQRVIHEHTHRFENSIQEKGIDLNHNFPQGKPSGFYITKQEDDFYYKGKRLHLSKSADYFKTFAALHALLPEGGELAYADLIVEVKSRIPKLKHEQRSDDEMRKFVQRNLTDKGNGFLRYAGIPETEDNGKPLIEVIRGTGIAFNNKTG